MGFYRDAPDRVSYGPWWIPVQFDPYEVGVGAVFLTIFLTQAVMWPFLRWTKIKVLQQALITWSIFVGWVLIHSYFSFAWQEDEVTATAAFAGGYAEHIHAKIGVHIGLQGFNVTMVGEPLHQLGANQEWNEQVLWSESEGQVLGWHQGRVSFGPYGSIAAQRFRQMQLRGVPKPVTDVVEWFTLDGERLRWGRWYRVAGFYTAVFLWAGFAMWMLTNVIFVIRPKLGAVWLTFLGVDMWFCVALYDSLLSIAEPELVIPVGDKVLKPEYAWGFWLLLSVGIINTVLGVVLYYFLGKHGYSASRRDITPSARMTSTRSDKDKPVQKNFHLTRLQTTRSKERLREHFKMATVRDSVSSLSDLGTGTGQKNGNDAPGQRTRPYLRHMESMPEDAGPQSPTPIPQPRAPTSPRTAMSASTTSTAYQTSVL